MLLNPFASVSVKYNSRTNAIDSSEVNLFAPFKENEEASKTEDSEAVNTDDDIYEDEIDELPFQFNRGDNITVMGQNLYVVLGVLGRGSFGDVYLANYLG